LTWLDANIPGRDTQVTSVHGAGTMPEEFALSQNYPNPFNPSTKITYTLKSNGKVRFSVYDLLGREVAVPVNNERKTAGQHEVTFDAANLPSGVYFYKLQTESHIETKRMLLIK
jgi:hypothetical protein